MRGSGCAREQYCCNPWWGAPCVAVQMERRASLPSPCQRFHKFFTQHFSEPLQCKLRFCIDFWLSGPGRQAAKSNAKGGNWKHT